MSRAIGAAVAALLVGCTSSYQSARLLAPGQSQVTVGVARSEQIGDDFDDDSIWNGDVQMRVGLSERFEGGLRLSRVPGSYNNASLLGFDPKVALTAPDATTAVSVSLPLYVLWEEQGSEPGEGTIIIVPSAFIGVDVSPSAELVFAPKLFWILPDGKTDEDELELGGSIGVRFADASRSWAVHPEIGLLHVSSGGQSESYVVLGLGIAAGN